MYDITKDNRQESQCKGNGNIFKPSMCVGVCVHQRVDQEDSINDRLRKMFVCLCACLYVGMTVLRADFKESQCRGKGNILN